MASGEGTEFSEIHFEVEPNYAGWRLDRYLCEKIRRLSRAKVQRLIRERLKSASPLKPSTPVTPGLRFSLVRPRQAEPDTPTDVAVLYQDSWVCVVDKPAGLPVHPTARYHRGTLVEVLKHKLGPSVRADPAHRLDRETSGLLVCGIGAESSRLLMNAFFDGQVHKEYLAITEGAPAANSFDVDAPIAEGTDLIRIAVRIDPLAGKPSRTRFEVVERFHRQGAPFALVRCFPLTGRQHQIRIHLRHAGFPLVGDKMYGPDEGYFDRFSRHCLEEAAWERLRLPRHALHAAHLSFPHPHTREPLSFTSPLPEDLEAFRAGAQARGGMRYWPEKQALQNDPKSGSPTAFPNPAIER